MLNGFLISHIYLGMLAPPLRAISYRSFHASRLLSMRGPLTFDGWYPRDHKPGEYPTTDEERRAAAIKFVHCARNHFSFHHYLLYYASVC
ncbi:hypothetical protein ANCCAN_27862 [Ancylostoma caninum]|uniref:Uncharacterized protein n=1 Tax=Ancylostoma caninum TaxID=29170 RepID=A0A368F2X3_ANCCA|nr:hypothetical protein ANCCAN_27862 [Ancylostoma caninum]